MKGNDSLLAIAVILSFALFTGFYATSSSDPVESEPDVTVETCESLPEYDYERMVERVEEIKGKELKRNVSICAEQSSDGIDTTSSQRQFAHLQEPEVLFFELDTITNAQQRSSLGYTEFSLSGGPIEIFLADETVAANASWISYEGLVAHELSHAIDNSHFQPSANDSRDGPDVGQTTDWLLANRAVSEGSATYVSELYVEKHDGRLDVSKLGEDDRGWKHQIVVSTYSEGYYYSKEMDITSSNEHRVNSTAQILHPGRTEDPSEFPPRPTLSLESLEHVRNDRVGALFVREVLRSKGLDTDRVKTVVDGWANDRLDYYRGNDFDVVTWHTEWQTERDSSEFVSAYGDMYEYSRVDSLQSVTCEESNRYLVASGKTVTVVSCSN